MLMHPPTDMTGQRHGRLVALSLDPAHEGSPRWLCACDCGATTSVRGNALRAGQVKSCGCLRREGRAGRLMQDLTGRVFGRLTVLRRVTTPAGRRGWRCLCTCGNETVVRTGLLSSGNTKSCGCGKAPMTKAEKSARSLATPGA